jgi:hypothetical protein
MRQEGYTQLVGNTGYLLLKVPQEILGEIKISVDKIQNNFNQATPINKALAGQIDKEYMIKLTYKATQYIKWAVERYYNINQSQIKSISKGYFNPQYNPTLEYKGNAWVNFQEKYEYNPIHRHGGVFSYVIWYQIPFYREDEIKYGAGKGKIENNSNGDFHFIYYDSQCISSHGLAIDKTMEGWVAIFPSYLNHTVYPFYTSDDYRITVSGNVYLKE